MCNRSLCGLLIVGLLGTPAAAFGDASRSYPVRVVAQLARGLTNAAASPLELMGNMYKEQQRAHDSGANVMGEFAGVLTGTFTGVAYTLTRVLVAAGEIATFPIPTQPWMHPATPDIFFERLGPPSPHGPFRLARRDGQTPRYEPRFWQKTGASEGDWYRDRYDCARQTLRNGLFNACLEARGWQRSAQEY